MPHTPGKEQEVVSVVQANPAASCPITSRPYIEPVAKFPAGSHFVKAAATRVNSHSDHEGAIPRGLRRDRL